MPITKGNIPDNPYDERSYPVVPETTPGWRQRLEAGSFRGITFWCDASSASFGRRVAVMRMAGYDGSIQQDLGREPVEMDLTVFVWGPDYDLHREKVETAFSEAGPAELVVPWRGPMWARVTRGPQISESKDEGGYAAIRVSFIIEEQDQVSLRSRPDAKAPVKAAAVKVVWTAKESFIESASLVRRYPELGFEKVVAGLEAATDSVRRVQNIAMRTPEAARSITRAIDELNDAVASLLTVPSEFATTLVDLMQTALVIPESRPIAQVTGVPAMLWDVAEQTRFVMRATYAVRSKHAFASQFWGRNVNLNDPVTREEVAVSLIPFWIERITYTAAVCAAADLYTQLPFDSAPAALWALDELNKDIDNLMVVATDAEYVVLADLRARLSEYIYEEASKLRETITVDLTRDTPALLVAFTLYGDAMQEADVVSRNNLREPMFARGAITVLRP